jgi:uncharacterized membrane protein (UPF0127 family)
MALVVGLIGLTVGGCSSGSGSGSAPATAGAGSTTSPTSGAALVPAPAGFHAVTVTVRAADGTVSTRCLLVADTRTRQEQGLMGVTDAGLGGYDGMIFVFPGATTSPFWMKDTLIPLSIAFVDEAGAVVTTADMVPCPSSTRECPRTSSSSPYRYAVEVGSGRLPAVGLVDGASLDPTFGPSCPPAGSVVPPG